MTEPGPVNQTLALLSHLRWTGNVELVGLGRGERTNLRRSCVQRPTTARPRPASPHQLGGNLVSSGKRQKLKVQEQREEPNWKPVPSDWPSHPASTFRPGGVGPCCQAAISGRTLKVQKVFFCRRASVSVCASLSSGSLQAVFPLIKALRLLLYYTGAQKVN